MWLSKKRWNMLWDRLNAMSSLLVGAGKHLKDLEENQNKLMQSHTALGKHVDNCFNNLCSNLSFALSPEGGLAKRLDAINKNTVAEIGELRQRVSMLYGMIGQRDDISHRTVVLRKGNLPPRKRPMPGAGSNEIPSKKARR